MKRKSTRSQQVIQKLLRSARQEISAQEIYIELQRRQQNIGLATVYRALKAMQLKGEVQARNLANGEAVYSLLAEDRHHLTCLQCGRSISIDHCPLQPMEDHLKESTDFKIYYHTLEFFGLCRPCAQQEILEETAAP